MSNEERTIADVMLWGTKVGAVLWNSNTNIGSFEYSTDFIKAPIELSPIKMPNVPAIYSFPALNRDTFKGLPGMLSDSLPDKFGNALIDQWLVSTGKKIKQFNPVHRLCYIGTRGMGALEFVPASYKAEQASERINVADMVDLASQILKKRKSQSWLVKPGSSISSHQALTNILHIGTSAGGARAKAIISWNEKTNEVRSGQVQSSSDFTYWLFKFDGVDENSDKELNDPKGFGRIEYAYYLMAKAAGISMSRSRLFEENGRAHFMTERFDRLPGGSKLHMQSMCALGHYDFNQAGAYSYEQALSLITHLPITNKQEALEEQFRRMCFNVVARNQDDHTKNIAFLMDRKGAWSLSPAFDVCYSYNEAGQWTSTHQMTINGKRDDFLFEDLIEAAKFANLRPPKVRKILDEVVAAVSAWRIFAEQANVTEENILQISKTHRLNWH